MKVVIQVASMVELKADSKVDSKVDSLVVLRVDWKVANLDS